jgi:hypothetical protein
MMHTELANKMIARADADGLPDEHEIRVLAAEFDEVSIGWYSEPQTCSVAKFMKHWARARSAWCKYSGEALI